MHKLYNHKWRVLRARFLQQHPLCVFCSARGKTTAAYVVDHITPHKGDEGLFWNQSNWQALCKPCHDIDKARIERGKSNLGCDVHGNPIGRDW